MVCIKIYGIKYYPCYGKTIGPLNVKNKKKLNFLANELDKNGRCVEARVVRTIVKPYVRDLNLKWRKMTALDKLLTVQL